jgi:hypothetical protein
MDQVADTIVVGPWMLLVVLRLARVSDATRVLSFSRLALRALGRRLLPGTNPRDHEPGQRSQAFRVDRRWRWCLACNV